LSLTFNEEVFSGYCKVRPNIGKIDLMSGGKIDEDRLTTEIGNVKNGPEANFSEIGDISGRIAEIAELLIDNGTLKTLTLASCSLVDTGAIEIFKALQENMYLTTLDLSSNELTKA
jgi:hypothetical protein